MNIFREDSIRAFRLGLERLRLEEHSCEKCKDDGVCLRHRARRRELVKQDDDWGNG